MARIAQLRGVMPALDESDITRERLALEEAIRKVEAESARLFVEASRRMSAEKLRQARQSAAQPLVEADFITELEQLLSKFRSQSADPVADLSDCHCCGSHCLLTLTQFQCSSC